MAWATEIVKDGVGIVWCLDVSTDNFATVAYRWATGSFVDGSGNRYDGRIKEIGKFQRNLGPNNLPVAGTTNLVLDNSDFACDWLVDRATFLSAAVKTRFRLKLGVYDPKVAYVSHPSIDLQTMGEFVSLDWASRDAKLVKLTLADDTLGRIADLALAPSIDDWVADGSATTSNCLFKDSAVEKVGNWAAPTQLAFGSATFRLEKAHEGVANLGTADRYGAVIICATTDTGASGDTPMVLFAEYRDNLFGFADLSGRTIQIPDTFTGPAGTSTIWSLERSVSLSKDGKTWRLQWIKFNIDKYRLWFDTAYSNKYQPLPTSPLVMLYPSYREGGSVGASSTFAQNWAAFAAFHYSGYPLSARTSTGYLQNGVDVLTDLISYYSNGASAADIDATSFAEVKAATQLQPVAGVIQPWVPAKPVGQGLAAAPSVGATFGSNKLREAITEICGTIDTDLFISWTGLFKLASLKVSFADFTTTPSAIDEARLAGVQEFTPSSGERWAPYNRLYVVQPDGQQVGPFDHPTTAAASGGWGKIFSRTINGRWGVDIDGAGVQAFVWQRRGVESVHRPGLRFVTDPSSLVFDLASYVLISWTRNQGGSTPYASTIFRIEGFTIDPRTMSVLLDLVWMHDLQSEKPYLLDNETLIVRASGNGGRTLDVTATNAQVAFSSGDLIADGVVAGDILCTKYNPTNANDFTVARRTRIVSVDDATHCTVVWSGWSTTSGISAWEIHRGATTYHNSSSDPVNYPDGGTMYGKASGATDLFSDASSANRLKDG